nr:DUF4326 domain-containing protein [Aeromonas veronii]
MGQPVLGRGIRSRPRHRQLPSPPRRHESHRRSRSVRATRQNLACWCKPGEACHADVLLALANDETQP